MTRLGRLVCACVIATCALGAAASAASATTFYVNKRGGTNSNTCTHPAGAAEGPCETIKGAIHRAEEKGGVDTIEVASEGGAEGLFEEQIILNSGNDKSLTIQGEEPGVIIRNTGSTAAVVVDEVASPITLSNLEVQDQKGSHAVIADNGAALTLDNVVAINDSESEGGTNGIEASPGSSLTINGGEVAMERNTEGAAILADEAPLTVSGTKVFAREESEAEGISSRLSTLSIANSTVAEVEPPAGAKDSPAINAEKDTSVSLTNDRAEGETSLTSTVKLTESPATINGLNVEMRNSKSIGAALEVRAAPATIAHLQTSGSWGGDGLLAIEGNTTLSDSSVATNTSPAATFIGGKETSMLVQRSILQAGPGAEPGALKLDDGNATVDSSEILGGKVGVAFIDGSPIPVTFTLAASTLDAGAPGLAADAAGVAAVEAEPAGSLASANTVIEGSIVLEPDTTKATAGGISNFLCSYSAVAVPAPSGCEPGKSGNTNATTEATSLFASPFASYALSPTSSAIDSVPVSAIALPAGLTPSATDLAGNPRSESVACNAVQDKGALELPGRGTPCSVPPVAVPIVARLKQAVITALTLSRSAFLPAPSGATLSTPKGKAKKYGTTISYRDSQVATTTFTILRKSSGRKKGKACQRPSRRNRHGKHCALLTKLGSFTHSDRAGANSLHFSGRIKGRELPAGSYELEVVARDAAGSGPAVIKSFTIK